MSEPKKQLHRMDMSVEDFQSVIEQTDREMESGEPESILTGQIVEHYPTHADMVKGVNLLSVTITIEAKRKVRRDEWVPYQTFDFRLPPDHPFVNPSGGNKEEPVIIDGVEFNSLGGGPSESDGQDWEDWTMVERSFLANYFENDDDAERDMADLLLKLHLDAKRRNQLHGL